MMQDLSRAGSHVLPRSVPDSGTAERLFWGSLVAALGGAPHLPGANLTVPALVGSGVAAAPYTPLGMRIRRWAMPGAARRLAAQPLETVAPYVSPATAAMLRDYGRRRRKSSCVPAPTFRQVSDGQARPPQ